MIMWDVVKQARQILNFRLIFHFLGLALLIESLFMTFDLVICVFYDSGSLKPVGESLFITLLTGALLFVVTRPKMEESTSIRDSFVIVFLSWLFLSLFGTLPFILSHAIQNFPDALFESISGFTTTGSSILTNIEAVPRGILFWRSETHWIGGMGIIVLVLAVFPFYKVNSMQLFGAEASVVVFEKLKPRLIDNVKRIWFIYLGLTLAETVLLEFGGMDLLDSLAHAFGTIATGGFSTRNASVEAFSPYIQYVILLFMMLSGINFALHYLGVKGKFKRVFRNEELRLYLTFIMLSGSIITFFLFQKYDFTLEKAFRDAFFQVVSIVTCTGYSTTDYLKWPSIGLAILFFLMMIGGSAGSTSGGIKVVRILILFKRLKIHIFNLLHPAGVRPLKYNKNVLDEKQQSTIMSFVFVYVWVFIIGTFVMSLLGLDIRTAAGSIVTTMGGIGPGFGMVGPAGNFSAIPAFGKFFLSFYMILGRLEILTVLAMFNPGFWRP